MAATVPTRTQLLRREIAVPVPLARVATTIAPVSGRPVKRTDVANPKAMPAQTRSGDERSSVRKARTRSAAPAVIPLARNMYGIAVLARMKNAPSDAKSAQATHAQRRPARDAVARRTTIAATKEAARQ